MCKTRERNKREKEIEEEKREKKIWRVKEKREIEKSERKAQELEGSRNKERERVREWKGEDDEGSHDVSPNSGKYPCLSPIFFIK